MLKRPVPGEAPLDPRSKARSAVLVSNITLGSLTGELHADAMLDTGAALCIVPPSFARSLGFHSGNRHGVKVFDVVGGGQVSMDLHRLSYLRVGTSEAYNVPFAVALPGPKWRIVLLGLSFVEKFGTTTVDLDEERVVFRSKKAHR